MFHSIKNPICLASLSQLTWFLVKINPIPAETRTVKNNKPSCFFIPKILLTLLTQKTNAVTSITFSYLCI